MEEKQKGRFETFFFIVMMPALFIILFGGMILFFLDMSFSQMVQGWGNKDAMSDSVKVFAEEQKAPSDWKQKVEQSLSQVKEKEEKIIELKKQVALLKKETEDLTDQNKELQLRLEQKQTKQYVEQMREVTEIYANMPTNKAALILESLPLEESALIIALLEQEKQSSILGRMKDVKAAGEIILLLKEIGMIEETDPEAIKVKIREYLANRQEESTETLTNSQN